MIRIQRRAVITDVARHALLRSSLVNAVLMATGTSERRVSARQRKLRVGCMVETRALPRRRCVTDRAILRESGG